MECLFGGVIDPKHRLHYYYVLLKHLTIKHFCGRFIHISCLNTSSSFCCQSSVYCAILSIEFKRTSGFRCRRPDDMELTAETSVWSYSHHISVFGRLLKTFFFSEY